MIISSMRIYEDLGYVQNLLVYVQGVGLLTSNLSSAEPLAAA